MLAQKIAYIYAQSRIVQCRRPPLGSRPNLAFMVIAPLFEDQMDWSRVLHGRIAVKRSRGPLKRSYKVAMTWLERKIQQYRDDQFGLAM